LDPKIRVIALQFYSLVETNSTMKILEGNSLHFNIICVEPMVARLNFQVGATGGDHTLLKLE
jgi:hypothetical protein